LAKHPYNKVAIGNKPNLLPFNHIFIAIPRDYIVTHYESTDLLEPEDTRRLVAKYKQIEQAIEQLRHTNSIIERILYKSKDRRYEI